MMPIQFNYPWWCLWWICTQVLWKARWGHQSPRKIQMWPKFIDLKYYLLIPFIFLRAKRSRRNVYGKENNFFSEHVSPCFLKIKWQFHVIYSLIKACSTIYHNLSSQETYNRYRKIDDFDKKLTKHNIKQSCSLKNISKNITHV